MGYDVEIARIDPEATEAAIPFRKGEETAFLREAVNKALEEMAGGGTLSQLSVKYFGTDISQLQD